MLKVAHILPSSHINENMPRQEFEMYLTHKVLEDPDKFRFLSQDQAKMIKSYKILDNSACELGEGLDFDKVLQAAEIIGANEIVLPDIPRSGVSFAKTLLYASELTDQVKAKYQIAAVVQGETEEQILACAEQILSLNCINTIMIPKWYCSLNSSNGLGRHSLTKKIFTLIQAFGSDVDIHWLGLDTGARELISPLANVVRSVDTGYFAALSTPQWSHLHALSERPRELKINLESMDVDMERWNNLRHKLQKTIEEV